MKLISIPTLAALIALSLVSGANATVLNFEGLTSEDSIVLSDAAANYGDFNWSSSFYLYNSSVFPVTSHSGDYGIVSNFGASPLDVSSATAFSFNGAWLNSWYFNAPEAVTISGYDSLENLVGSVTQIMAPESQLYVAANFNGVNRVEFTGGFYFTIDDFTFNEPTNEVPEANGLVLIGIGVLAMFWVRRKNALGMA